MARFERVPFEIEAELFPCQKNEPIAFQSFRSWVHAQGGDCFFCEAGTLEILTSEGVMTAHPGDYVIRGVKGELYPCKADVFARSYRPVALVH